MTAWMKSPLMNGHSDSVLDDVSARQEQNARLRRELERAHTIIDVQKKLCTVLGLPTEPDADEEP